MAIQKLYVDLFPDYWRTSGAKIVIVKIRGEAFALHGVSKKVIAHSKDHTIVFREAINKADVGDTIVVNGEFEIETVEVNKPVKIVINGIIKHKTGLNPLFRITASGVRFKGGKLDGNAQLVDQSHHSLYNCAFHIRGSETNMIDNIVIEGVEITNFEGHTIIVEYAKNVSIVNCHIHDTGKQNYGMDGVAIHYGNNIRITNTVFENIRSPDNYGGGVEILASTDFPNKVEDVVIEKCYFNNIGEFAVGISFLTNTPYEDYPKGVRIVNNTIINSKFGIYIRAGREIYIGYNRIVKTDEEGIMIREWVRSFTVESNFIKAGKKGIYVVGIKDNISGDEEERGIIVGNEIFKCAEEGIRVEYIERVKVIGNVVNNNKIGIHLYGWQYYTDVQNNIVQKNSVDGIKVENVGYSIITGNIIVDNGGYGINVLSHHNLIIKNNVVRNNSSGSITGTDTTDIVRDNKT